MFPHSLVADSDSDNRVTPVADKLLGSSLKNRFAGDYFGPCFVDLKSA